MKRYMVLPFALLLGGCLTGCATFDANLTPEQQRLKQEQGKADWEQYMAALEQAQFEGEIYFETAGTPFAIRASTTWGIGPTQTTFRANGRVDFRTISPRVAPAGDSGDG